MVKPASVIMSTGKISKEEICDAAEALRDVEISAVREGSHTARPDDDLDSYANEARESDSLEKLIAISEDLAELSIDSLRGVAGMLQIPNYAQITDQKELLATIRMYLEPRARRVPR